MKEKAFFIGKRFGRLVIVDFDHEVQMFDKKGRKNGVKQYYKCKCDCGNEKIASLWSLRDGHTLSCGCLQREKNVERLIIHNLSASRIYRIWRAIKNRCLNKKLMDYKNYGGRGIKVCEEWKNDFMSFYNWSMAHDYADDLTIDRIDVNGNYSPENCKWSTKKEQSNNRRTCCNFTYNGVTKNYKQWCEFLNINYKTFYSRISRGWEIKKALGFEEKDGTDKII